MTNAMNNLRAFEENLVCVKACVFKKTKNDEYATVLCCVPQNDYGKVKLQILSNGKCPESCGTFIRTIGPELISPTNIITLSRYERYLEKEGWEFAFTVKKTKGKHTREAFEICRTAISVAKRFIR